MLRKPFPKALHVGIAVDCQHLSIWEGARKDLRQRQNILPSLDGSSNRHGFVFLNFGIGIFSRFYATLWNNTSPAHHSALLRSPSLPVWPHLLHQKGQMIYNLCLWYVYIILCLLAKLMFKAPPKKEISGIPFFKRQSAANTSVFSWERCQTAKALAAAKVNDGDTGTQSCKHMVQPSANQQKRLSCQRMGQDLSYFILLLVTCVFYRKIRTIHFSEAHVDDEPLVIVISADIGQSYLLDLSQPLHLASSVLACKHAKAQRPMPSPKVVNSSMNMSVLSFFSPTNQWNPHGIPPLSVPSSGPQWVPSANVFPGHWRGAHIPASSIEIAFCLNELLKRRRVSLNSKPWLLYYGFIPNIGFIYMVFLIRFELNIQYRFSWANPTAQAPPVVGTPARRRVGKTRAKQRTAQVELFFFLTELCHFVPPPFRGGRGAKWQSF